ncbi:MAG: UDP-3-O-(3-hydroxymyristoyl)glucosamine N-acyltransferase [Verrucomicrobia bacterium]|nr:UDP-3-O-(3-hydroxymyristoyl)glucosamine N-acyltransferase [Cytophagales bacterium]
MEFSVEQISILIAGTVEGDKFLKINNLSNIEKATEGCVSFLANPKYEPFLYTTQASAVIVSHDLELKKKITPVIIRVKDPYLAFTVLLEQYHQLNLFSKQGIEQPSYISASAKTGSGLYLGAFAYIGSNCEIGENVKIYPHVFVGDNVKIGNNTIIYTGAKVYQDCIIGNYCVIHAGAVIGSDGFGFAPQADGSYKAIPQVGNVILEDKVSIGSNTTIDRATMPQSSTLIREGAKLDNLIQIAHNVEIGRHTVVAAQTGISGSTKIGDYCVIAGQVGIVGHLTIANKTSIGAQSGVGKSVTKSGTAIQGSPAFDYKQNLKSGVVFRKLPDLQSRLEALEKNISSEK